MIDETYMDDYLVSATRCAMSIPKFSNSSLEIKEYNAVTIYPNRGGVISQINGTDKYDFEEAIYIGFQYNCWGHLLTETFSRFWFLQKEPFSKFQSIPILVSTNDEKIAVQFVQMLKGLVKNLNVIVTSNETKVHRLFVPEASFFHARHNIVPDKFDGDNNGSMNYTKEYIQLVDNLKYILSHNYVPIFRNNKVFFSPQVNDKILGLKTIEKLFKKAGFEIYKPHEHSFLEQYSRLVSCKTFATIEGSISFNTLFLNKEANVVLIRKAPIINHYQTAINEITQHNVKYIDSNGSIFLDKRHKYIGPFVLYANGNLCRFLNNEYNINVKPRVNIFLLFWYAIKVIKTHSYIGNSLGLDDFEFETPSYLLMRIANDLKSSIRNRFFIKIIHILCRV